MLTPRRPRSASPTAATITSRLRGWSSAPTGATRRSEARFVDRQRVHESGRLLAGVRLANVRSEPDSGYFILDDERAGVASLFPQGDGFARAYVFAQGDEPSSYLGSDGFARFIEAQIAMGVPEKVIGEARASAAGPLAAFRADESWVERPAEGALAPHWRCRRDQRRDLGHGHRARAYATCARSPEALIGPPRLARGDLGLRRPSTMPTLRRSRRQNDG